LEKAGFQIDVASTEKGTAVGVNGGEAEVNFAVEEVNVDDYQAIVFVGGPGASRNIENQRFHHLAREAMAKIKFSERFALRRCILARAGVLENRKATVWTSALDRRPIQQLKDGEATYENKPVVVDGNIITANGPQSAKEFGKTILKLLKSSQQAN